MARTDNQRSSTHLRPRTHNPFNTGNKSNEKSREKDVAVHQQPDSRSRAVSASNNIKISFMSSLEHQAQQKKEGVMDYKGEWQQMQAQSKNIYKLGTLENKQMRQSYQMNSFNNELIPQDYPRTPNIFYSPKPAVCSSPISPKIMHSPRAKGGYLSPPITQQNQGPNSPGVHRLGQ